jgi:uncharacterized protein with FMN-binding domain
MKCVVVVVVLSVLWGSVARAAEPVVRSVSEVLALIAKAGPTKPDWWDDVKDDWPKTLKLNWETIKGWNPNTNLGAYVRQIRRQPKLFRPTVKLMHKVVEVNKADAKKRLTSMRSLGEAYCMLEGDYARGAYWYSKALRAAGSNARLNDLVGLADCYLRLGCKPLAEKIVSNVRVKSDRNGVFVRLYGRLGKPVKAATLAKAQLKGRYPDAALLAIGDACRYNGRDADAVRMYEKAIALPKGGRDLARNKQRAKRHLTSLKAVQNLKLTDVPDGTYTGSSKGFRAPVNVKVTVKDGRIESVKIVQHKEDWAARSLTDIPEQIVQKQNVRSIDMLTGATYTSEAILNAVCNALGTAKK